MKAASLLTAASPPLVQARLADYVELIRLRVSVLVLFTVAAGAFLASRGALDAAQLVHVLLGTALVASGASALNQLLERQTDALMSRTENRPLPAGCLPSKSRSWGAYWVPAGWSISRSHCASRWPREWRRSRSSATCSSTRRSSARRR
jgi:heme O synthase-like polyprenyltransferase